MTCMRIYLHNLERRTFNIIAHITEILNNPFRLKKNMFHMKIG